MVPPPPPLPEEVWEEILLRLPPDDPASLLRASLVCKLWRRIASHRGFLRRLGELHGAAPMLGFFHNSADGPGPAYGTSDAPRFVPTTAASAFSVPVPESRPWSRFLGCRHGRALLVSLSASWLPQELLVWEPLTGYQRRVPLPASVKLRFFNAAVVCVVDGCDHWACHGGHFRVVVVSSSGSAGSVASACEYSSETGAWGEPIPAIHQSRRLFIVKKGSLLLGKSLYFLCGLCEILEYDLNEQVLAVINPADAFSNYCNRSILMQADDGGLGIAGIQESRLYLWSRQRSGEYDCSSDAGWVLRRTIHLENLLPAAALSEAGGRRVPVAGFAEDANVIFLGTDDGNFTIELKSGRSRKVSSRGTSSLFPFHSFYAPGI